MAIEFTEYDIDIQELAKLKLLATARVIAEREAERLRREEMTLSWSRSHKEQAFLIGELKQEFKMLHNCFHAIGATTSQLLSCVGRRVHMWWQF